MKRDQIVGLLEDLAYEERDDKYRSQAFTNGALALKRFHLEEISLKDLFEISKLPGVGKGILARIETWILQGVTESISDKREVMDILQKIYGVGPVTAEGWYNKGVRKLKDIHELKLTLTPSQEIGLKFYYDIQERIPRKEISMLEEQMYSFLEYIQGSRKDQIVIAGSYRRGLETSGDIDIIIDKTICDSLFNFLYEYGLVEYILSRGQTKILCIGGLACSQLLPYNERKDYKRRRIDFEIVSPENMAPALLYFTGSKDFNKMSRGVAKEKGYLLNHEGLFKDGKKLDTPTEKDIFRILEIEWKEPHER